jgi:hypothetical protein
LVLISPCLVVNSGKVIFNIDYPVSVSKEDISFTFNKFNIEIPVRLETVHRVAQQITQQHVEYEGVLCVNCLYDTAEENKVIIDMLPYEENSTMFAIVDTNSEIKGGEYIFYFMTR